MKKSLLTVSLICVSLSWMFASSNLRNEGFRVMSGKPGSLTPKVCVTNLLTSPYDMKFAVKRGDSLTPISTFHYFKNVSYSPTGTQDEVLLGGPVSTGAVMTITEHMNPSNTEKFYVYLYLKFDPNTKQWSVSPRGNCILYANSMQPSSKLKFVGVTVKGKNPKAPRSLSFGISNEQKPKSASAKEDDL